MSFIWPVMLVFLLMVPLFVALYILLQRRRQRFAVQYGSLALLRGAAARGPGRRRHIPPALFLLALTILIVALARPQTTVSLPKQEGTVILAIDVSGSMGADDLKPNRMEAAKAAARAFIQHQPSSVQVGIVAFSDSGFTVQAPTTQQEALLATINRLTPQRGTSVGNGIIGSLNTIAQESGQAPLPGGRADASPTPTPTPVPKGTYIPAAIVLLSDGDNNEAPDPLAAAQAAADRGVRVYTVGIGSPQGAVVHINGFSIRTQLDEGMLRQISQLTGGAYYNAESEKDLLQIYENLQPQLVLKTEKTEVTAFFAGAGIVVLLLGGMLSLVWFGRLP